MCEHSKFFTVMLFISTLLLIIHHVNSLSNVVVPDDYGQNVVSLGQNMKMYWKADIANDLIEIALTSTLANGWIAIGIGHQPSSGMKDADCILAHSDDSGSGVVVEDLYLNNVGEAPIRDTNIGGTYSILESNGTVLDGILHVKVLRRINATESTDKSITDSDMRLSWAIRSSSKSYTSVHNSDGKLLVNMLADSNPVVPVGPKVVTFKYHLVVSGAFIVILVVFGLISTIMRAKLGHTYFYYLLMKKTVIRTRWVDLNEIVTYTLGEIFVISIYVLSAVTWFLYGFYKEDVYRWGRAFGYLNILNLSIVLLPVTRHSVWTWIFSISYERAIRYHRTLGLFTILFATAHFISFMVHYAKNDIIRLIFKWDYFERVAKLPGFISYLFMLIIALTSAPPIRRFLWDAFQTIHVISATCVIVFAVLHVAGEILLPYIAFSLLLYLGDVFIRYLAFIGNRNFLAAWSNNIFSSVRSCQVEYRKDADIVNINLLLDKHLVFNNSGTYEEQTKELRRSCLGKYIHLWILQVSPWESHPFSISNVTVVDDKTVKMELNIKKTRSKVPLAWTKRLSTLAEQNTEFSPMARFDGPFGTLTIPLENPDIVKQYDKILLFAGGIGITPLQMLTKHCIEHNPETYLHWVMPNEGISNNFPELHNLGKHVQMYHTKSGSRPNMREIIQSCATESKSATVAVVACGPATMIGTVVESCTITEFKNPQIRFHVHTELFTL